MGQVRHGSAATTHAVRAAIQRSQASLAQLSKELGINPKTVAKWRKRATVEDLKTGPREPRQFMAHFGLTPSEYSSGVTVRHGGITKAGSGLTRRALIEGAWSYRMQARISRKPHDRIEGLPNAVRDIS